MLAFVIPAFDEARRIGATLDAVHAAVAALGLAADIVVADDASTDATAAIATAHGARVVPVAHRHIAATRNAGAAATTAEVLVFVDADTRIDARLLDAALAALADGAVGGGATVRLEGRPPWHVRLGVWAAGVGFRWRGIAPGCFVFCTRVAFDAVGGFDERWYAGEDIALSRALATQGRFVILRAPVFTSGRKLHHLSPLGHLRLLLRFARRGRGMLTSRDALELWYGGRRDEPDVPPRE
ncbi:MULTISPECIES: glycosyltransferase [Luteimonas]|uniref:glycosyltransferase n=1 Tax=Luteimonas TaxID=83614 RepID=UPI000C7DEBF0|nr:MULTISPECIES: glycosyltransferase [Luteimonas]